MSAEDADAAELAALLHSVATEVDDDAERTCILNDGRRLQTGLKRDGTRALAKSWGVAQKNHGKNKSADDIRREVAEKIKSAARRLLHNIRAAELTEPAAASVTTERVVSTLENMRAAELTEPAVATVTAERALCAEPLDGEPQSHTTSRTGKRPRTPERKVADEETRVRAADAILAPLCAASVLKAREYLDTLPPGGAVDNLRALLRQWRAVGAVRGAHPQRGHLRQVASKFGIPLARKQDADAKKASSVIAEAFKTRVSLLRVWRPMALSAVALRDSGAGEPAVDADAAAQSSGHLESAAGSQSVRARV